MKLRYLPRARCSRAPWRQSAVAAAVAAVALTAVPFASAANELGNLDVYQPCCSGAALQGSRASITAPGIPSVSSGHQVLTSAGATDINQNGTGGLNLSQVGVQMDNGIAVDGDPSCFTAGQLTGFYEWFDYTIGGSRCKTLGSISPGATHLFSVAQQSTGGWQFFVDGSPQLSSPIIAMKGSYAANAASVQAGGEVNFVDGGLPEPIAWTTDLGGSGNTPWQRFNNTLGWYTIQQWNAVCNGAPNVCTGGSWQISTSSFPTVWSVSH